MMARKWFNPEILRWARERLKFSPEEVEEEARKLRRKFYEPVTAEEIRSWETGKGEPSFGQLETLAEIYVCPLGYFFLDAVPQVSPILSYRGLREEKKQRLSSLTLRTLERFLDLAKWTVDLIGKAEMSWSIHIRPGEVTPSAKQVDMLARKYRQRLGWTPEVRQSLGGDRQEAFRWWRRTLEHQGIFCFEMPLDPKDMRGASLWHEGYPFILVNHQDAEAAAGRLFTLLHEFAHLISTKGEGVVCDFGGAHKDQNPEPFANRFAARMLILPEELESRLGEMGEKQHRKDWPDSLLDRLRRPFMVSRDVVAILLQEIGLAPSDFYERKRSEWEEKLKKERRGRGGRRPSQKEQRLQELGFSLSELLIRATSRPDFSWIDAAAVVGMKVEQTEEFLRWASRQRGGAGW